MKHKQLIARGSGIAALLLLLAGGLMLGGCESDVVAPDDDLPELTEMEAAQQAALVAVGVAQVGPQLLKFAGLKAGPAVLGVYPYDFPVGGDITGSIVLEYFIGGAGGTHSTWDEADYGLLYTPEGEAVSVTVELVEGAEVIYSVTFNLGGPINRAADTATVSGPGTLIMGDFVQGFTLTNVLLNDVSSYPDGGTMDFLAGSVEITVTYDGSRYATATVLGGSVFEIDLDTGIVSSAAD